MGESPGSDRAAAGSLPSGAGTVDRREASSVGAAGGVTAPDRTPVSSLGVGEAFPNGVLPAGRNLSGSTETLAPFRGKVAELIGAETSSPDRAAAFAGWLGVVAAPEAIRDPDSMDFARDAEPSNAPPARAGDRSAEALAVLLCTMR